ncbi:MAG: hypothetical protein ACXAEU_26460 [Candidatus Hodarchaeales archaeon]|jgi:hypothetical protein
MPGALMGFALGLILERRKVNFESVDFNNADWKKKALLRAIVGLIVVIGLYLILSTLFKPLDGNEL